MGKNNKNKKKANTNDPDALKVGYQYSLSSQLTCLTVCLLQNEGNTAFQKGDYDKAIENYSRAIEQDASNAIYFSNSMFSGNLAHNSPLISRLASVFSGLFCKSKIYSTVQELMCSTHLKSTRKLSRTVSGPLSLTPTSSR